MIAAARGEEMGVNLLLMEKEGGKASGNIWRSCVLLVVCLLFACFIGVIAAARHEEMGANLLLMEKEGGKASGNIWRSCV